MAKLTGITHKTSAWTAREIKWFLLVLDVLREKKAKNSYRLYNWRPEKIQYNKVVPLKLLIKEPWRWRIEEDAI